MGVRKIKGQSIDPSGLELPQVARDGGMRRFPAHGAPVDIVFGESQIIPATKDINLKNVELLSPNREGGLSYYSLDGAHYDGRRGTWSFDNFVLPPDNKDMEDVKSMLMEAMTTGFTTKREKDTRAIRDKWHEHAKKIRDFKNVHAGMTEEQLADYYNQNSLHDMSLEHRDFLLKRLKYLKASREGQKGIDELKADKAPAIQAPPVQTQQPAATQPVAPVPKPAEKKEETEVAKTTQTPLTKKSSKLHASDIIASSVIGGATGLAAYGLSGFSPTIQSNKVLKALIGLASGVAAGAGTAWALTREQTKKAADQTERDPWDYDSVIYIPHGEGYYNDGKAGGSISGAAIITKNKDGSKTEAVTDGIMVGGDATATAKGDDTATLRVKHTDAEGNETLTDLPLVSKVIDTNKINSLQDAIKLIVASKGIDNAMNQSPETIARWRNRLIGYRKEKIDEAAANLRSKGKNLKAFGLQHKDELLSSGMGIAAGSLGYIGAYSGLGFVPWFKRHKGVRFLASLIAGTGLGIGAGKLTHKQLTRHYNPKDRATWADFLGTAGTAATDASDALRMSGHDITSKDINELVEQLN